MELKKLEYYAPEDLVQLLTETTLPLTQIAEQTDIPYPTLKNYRYGKTDADSMPHRMVMVLSDFFRQVRRDVIEVANYRRVILPDGYDTGQILKQFKVNGLLLDLYVLHELTLSRYNGKYEPSGETLFISKRVIDLLLKYNKFDYLADNRLCKFHLILEGGSNVKSSIAYPWYLSSTSSDVIVADQSSTLMLPSSLVGDKPLEPLNAAYDLDLLLTYVLQYVMALDVDTLKGMYKGVHPNGDNLLKDYLSQSFWMLNAAAGNLAGVRDVNLIKHDMKMLDQLYGPNYMRRMDDELNDNDYVVSTQVTDDLKRLAELGGDTRRKNICLMQKYLIETGVYTDILTGRYDLLFEDNFENMYRMVPDVLRSRDSLDPDYNDNLRYVTSDVKIMIDKTIPVADIKTLIRPVNFNWKLFAESNDVKRKKTIIVTLNTDLGISVIQSIDYTDKYGNHRLYKF